VEKNNFLEETAFWEIAPCRSSKYTDFSEVRAASIIRAIFMFILAAMRT
jgi:hypothetical protein